MLSVRVTPVVEDGVLLALNVSVCGPAGAGERRRSDVALGAALGELQATVDEMERAHEEMRATAFELETKVADLTRSNDALLVQNRGLESSNDDLQDRNHELRGRIDEAREHAGADGRDVAVIVVDRELAVRSWSAAAEALWGLGQRELLGKAILAIALDPPLEGLEDAVRSCMGGSPVSVRGGGAGPGAATDRLVGWCVPLREDGREVTGAVLVVEPRAG